MGIVRTAMATTHQKVQAAAGEARSEHPVHRLQREPEEISHRPRYLLGYGTSTGGQMEEKVMVNAGDPRNQERRSKVEKEALAFCFYEGKELVNVQYKTCDKDFLFTPRAEIIPYNLNAALLLDHDDTLYITEG